MGCGHDYESTPEELEAQRKYREQQQELEKHTIFAFYQFDKLAKPDPAEIGGAFGVKIVRDRQGILHWLDTKTWPFHYPFCVNILGETRTLQEFNEQVYTGHDRSMLFATVMAYPIGIGIKRHYCLELNPADPITDLDTMLDFFSLVQKNFIPSENHVLKFHPTSAKQVEVAQSELFKWPVITSAELFSNLEYKCIREGQMNAKYLRIFDKKTFTDRDLTDWLNQRTIDDIVVIPTVPADIPIVGAVICQEIIPPLCHVALLCQNRKTPCCFKSGIIDMLLNERQLTNQVVSSVIAKQGLSLHYEDAVVEPPWDVPAAVPIKQADLTVTSLVDWQHFDLRSVGTKAYQFSRIQTHYSQSTMDGTFVIPFYCYHQHISKSSVDVEKMKPDQIQHAINSQQIDEELVSSVIHRIKSNNWSAVIFRSSTNCEDLEQFNGAGLYESVPLSGEDLNDRMKVQHAIKQVWASVWSQRAVREREYYKISHKDVAMAVLVQPYLDNKMNGTLVKVLLNGVCITHDVGHHKVKHGFYVNCFPGSDLRATNHYKDATPEEVMLVLGRDEKAVDLRLIQQSNQCSQLLITQHDAETMARVFGEVHTMMLGKPHKMDDTVALDIEFMIVYNAVTGNPRELVVLQARPYQVPVNPPYISDYNMQLRLSINLHRYNDEKNYSFRFEYNG